MLRKDLFDLYGLHPLFEASHQEMEVRFLLYPPIIVVQGIQVVYKPVYGV